MIEYIIKFLVISSLSYLGCYFLIKYSTNHKTNRFWLLFCLCFSIILPLFSLSLGADNVMTKLNYIQMVESSNLLQTAGIENNIDLSGQINKISYISIILIVYIGVVLFLSIRFCLNIWSILKKRHNAKQWNYNGHKVYGLDANVKPFTFLNAIFISNSDWSTHPNKDELITHEIHHKNLKHSFDILLIETIKIFFWFHPILYAFKKLIKANHEYQADAAVILNGVDAKSYTNVIIDYTFIPRTRYNTLSSEFSHSLIKNRITMISKLKNSNNTFKQSLLMSALIVVLFLSTAFTIDTKDHNQVGHFVAEQLFYSQKNHHLYLKGKNIKIDYLKNNATGSGSFTFLGKIDYLQVNNDKIIPGTQIDVIGKRCTIKQISDPAVLSRLGLNADAKAYEVNIIAQ